MQQDPNVEISKLRYHTKPIEYRGIVCWMGHMSVGYIPRSFAELCGEIAFPRAELLLERNYDG